MSRKRTHSKFDTLKRYRKYVKRIHAILSGTNPGAAAKHKVSFLQKRLTHLQKKLNPLASPLRAAILSGMMLTSGHSVWAQPKITALAPATNANLVVSTSTIAITFSESMSAATIDADNIVIHGSQTGLRSTRGTFSGNPALSFNPDDNFFPNELITVSITNAQATGGSRINRALTYQFRTEAIGGSGIFSKTDLSFTDYEAVAAGDLDNDGDIDFVQVSANLGGDRIWLNNGDGTYQSSIFGSTRASDCEMGDLDGDGDLDVAIGVLVGANKIWLNNGDGTFVATTFDNGLTLGIDIADMDGDGDLDVISANSGAQPSIWLNDGSANLTNTTHGVASSYKSVAHGDIDSDGDIDLAFGLGYGYSNVLLINNGDGSFATKHFGSTGDFIQDIAIGDVNSDGKPDLILANLLGDGLGILLGNGDGTFSSSFVNGIFAEGVSLGDIDGDGDLDAIASGGSSSDTELFRNNGDGTFTHSSVELPNTYDAALADLDGDGDLDVISATKGFLSRILTNENALLVRPVEPGYNAAGVALDSDIELGFNMFMATTTLTVSPYSTASVRIFGSQTGEIGSSASSIDFDNFGRLTTIDPGADFKPGERISVSVTDDVVSSNGTLVDDGAVFQFRAKSAFASGDFTLQSVSFGAGFSGAVGDLNGDGNLDGILGGLNTQKTILIGNGDGTFSSSLFGASNLALAVEFGDLDADGDLDAIFAIGSNPREIWINNGDGTFASSTFDAGGHVSDLAIADMDGDGDLDVVFSGSNFSPERVWLNNGDATFQVNTVGSNTTARDVAIADFNRDGALDFATTTDGSSTMYFNNGDATFSSEGFGEMTAQSINTADFNGDGVLDVVFGSPGSGNSIWLNSGGTFEKQATVLPTSNDIITGDLNGDGLDDIVFLISSGARRWINLGNGQFAETFTGVGNALAGDMGDFNNDGRLDVLIAAVGNSYALINTPAGFAVNQFNPSSVEVSDAALDVTLTGDLLGVSSANVTYLNSSGATLGTRSVVLNSAYATAAHITLPAGAISTIGTLTVKLESALGSSSADLTVVNDQPIIQTSETTVSFPEDGSTTITLTLDDFWPGIPSLSITPPLTNGSTIASITQIGATMAGTQYQIVGATNAHGSAALTFLVSDGFLQSSTTIIVNIQAVNDLPKIDAPDKVTILQNGVSSATLLLSDQESAVTSLTVTATSANQSLIADGDIVLGATGATVDLSFTTACFTSGTTQIIVTVTDDAGTSRQTIDVCVVGYTETPISGSTLAACIGNSSEYHVNPSQNATSFLWSAVGGTILAGQGTAEIDVHWLSGTTHTLSLLRSYPNGCTSASTINLSPAMLHAASDLASTSPNMSVTLAVLNNDSGSGLSILSVDTPANGSVSHTNGIITYTPNSGFSGVETFNYTVESALACTAAGLVSVAVQAEAQRVNLEYLSEYKNRSGAIRGLNGAVNAGVSPDGKFVYVAGFSDHSIAIFARDENDGSLTYQSRVRNGSGGVSGLKYVSDLQITQDGRWLMAVGYGNDCLVVFERNQSTGDLTFADKRKHGQTDAGGKILALKRPGALSFSPDGANVYVASSQLSSIGVFQFDRISGELQWLERQKDGTNAADGLNGVLDMQVSPDGRHVYSAGYAEDKIGIFARDENSGSLTFLSQVRDGVNGVDGINGVKAIALSPDGKYLYAAGLQDDAVAVFSRNRVSGLLTFIERLKDGGGGITGLNGVSDVAVGSGGRQVWTSAEIDKALMLFNRNDDGSLTQADILTSAVKDVVGLGLLADGRYAYSSAKRADAASAIFRNIQPTAVDDIGQVTTKNSSLVISPLANDTDGDNHVLTIDSNTNGALGTVSITGGGTTLTYAAGNTSGADQFTYSISDGHGGSSTATVDLTVSNPKAALAVNKFTDAAQHAFNILVSPNPVGSQMSLTIDIAERSSLELQLLDMRGATVTTLAAGRLAPGTQLIEWDLSAVQLATGMYTLIVRAVGESQVQEGSRTVQVLR